MNINRLDFNLLKTFDAIYQERNVTNAAQKLGLAQSSMSNALSRLREQFDDPLFMRTPKGMEPTAKADELAGQVAEVLQAIQVMVEPKVFDPVTSEEQIDIAASDLAVMTLAPKLMPLLAARAPKLSLNFVPLEKRTVFSKLDDGSLSLAIGTFADVPAHFHRKTLMTEKFVCLLRKGNGAAGQPLTLDTYCQLPHVLMTLNADRVGVIDSALRNMGRKRKIVMTCAQFSPLADVVANTDIIATVPCSLTKFAERAGCEVHPLPIDMAPWDSELISSQRFQSSGLAKFLTGLFLEAAQS